MPGVFGVEARGPLKPQNLYGRTALDYRLGRTVVRTRPVVVHLHKTPPPHYTMLCFGQRIAYGNPHFVRRSPGRGSVAMRRCISRDRAISFLMAALFMTFGTWPPLLTLGLLQTRRHLMNDRHTGTSSRGILAIVRHFVSGRAGAVIVMSDVHALPTRNCRVKALRGSPVDCDLAVGLLAVVVETTSVIDYILAGT